VTAAEVVRAHHLRTDDWRAIKRRLPELGIVSRGSTRSTTYVSAASGSSYHLSAPAPVVADGGRTSDGSTIAGGPDAAEPGSPESVWGAVPLPEAAPLSAPPTRRDSRSEHRLLPWRRGLALRATLLGVAGASAIATWAMVVNGRPPSAVGDRLDPTDAPLAQRPAMAPVEGRSTPSKRSERRPARDTRRARPTGEDAAGRRARAKEAARRRAQAAARRVRNRRAAGTQRVAAPSSGSRPTASHQVAAISTAPAQSHAPPPAAASPAASTPGTGGSLTPLG
jgi:hypothetical protein